MDKKSHLPHVDSWIWGKEVLIWGAASTHQYTCKVLQPKVGRSGMLSLQYHHEKSESWIQLTGMSWAMIIINGVISTRIMRPGDVQNIECGVIHRLMGLTNDCQIIEPSTPDKHAADKTIAKDVVRLHCVLGREIARPRNSAETALIIEAIKISEDAIKAVESGALPEEINVSALMAQTGFQLDLSPNSSL